MSVTGEIASAPIAGLSAHPSNGRIAPKTSLRRRKKQVTGIREHRPMAGIQTS